MLIYPAIDLFEGKAVRLFKGDYARMTVYSDNPCEIAQDFKNKGALRMHVVDLEGAKSGTMPNRETVVRLKEESGLFVEVGGGIRTMDTIEYYLSRGIDRVILGTAAVTQEGFVAQAVAQYGEAIAVGVDIRDGYVAVKGWTQKSEFEAMDFCRKMAETGVKTLICTDISRDGAMQGTNLELYRKISRECSLDLIASGGVSSMEDIRRLRGMELHGAIVGKAYYTGAIDIAQAVREAQ